MIRSILIGTILLAVIGKMTLLEYGQLQAENAENLLEELDLQQTENYPGLPKLIFLTPWNKKGFEYSIKYSNKIDYVSPCWYSLMLNNKRDPVFQNQHNYDQSFVKSLKGTGSNTKVIPRVYLEGNQASFFQAIGSDRKKFNQAIGLIERIVRQKQLDGIVWDSPFNFFEFSRSSLNNLIVQFVKEIRNRLGKQKVIMFNLANPINHMNALQVQQYKKLPIDYLLIQNYDSGDDYLKMIQSSLRWSKPLKTYKIMLMLPFFSVKTRIGPISTEEAIRSLRRMGVASTHLSNGMCVFNQKKSKRQFLIPCFSYFKKAFQLAQQSQAGVGFWEGGNGIENYYKFL